MIDSFYVSTVTHATFWQFKKIDSIELKRTHELNEKADLKATKGGGTGRDERLMVARFGIKNKKGETQI